eukprot:g9461.t1
MHTQIDIKTSSALVLVNNIINSSNPYAVFGAVSVKCDSARCHEVGFPAFGIGCENLQNNVGIRCLKCLPGKYRQKSSTFSSCLNCLPGKYAANYGAMSCENCQRGQFQGSEGSAKCELCELGQYGNVSSTCFAIPPGFYGTNCLQGDRGCSDATICALGYMCPGGKNPKSSCPKGSTTTVLGSSTCILCEPGTYRLNESNKECVQCPHGFKCQRGTINPLRCETGTYAASGSSSCTACDLGKFTALKGQKVCTTCPPGQYQDGKGQIKCIPCPIDTFSLTTGNTAPAQCLKCTTDFALHTTTNYSVGVANASGCVCQGIDKTIEGNVGYYTNPTPTNKEDYCLRCPNGALCSNPNTKIATLGTKPGYWRSSTESNVFHECLNDIDCPGNANYSLQCRLGNTGVICAVCAENHVRFNDGLCTKCDEGANAIGLPLMIFVFGLVYIAVLVRYMIKAKISPKPNINVNKAVISMLVLSAVAKLKRGIKRSSSNINTVVENQVQEEAEDQAGEATGADAVTSMLVLSAVAKFKRGLKRSNNNMNTVVENQVQEEAEGQAGEATGDNAGEFDANNEPLLKFGRVGLACLAFPKIQTCCSKKKKVMKEVKKVEMVNTINPMHTKKKKSEVVVEVQPKKKPPRRSIATEERMKRIRRLSANRRPSASVLNALNSKELKVHKTAYI